ncbi:MAG TPA: OmpA family protein [Alphaproteobacteria bacterium]|jgi:outer membrane protein OmpA-like peptidoglycan-associated protein
MGYAIATRWAATGALLAALLAASGCSWVRDVTGWGEEDEARRPQPPGIQRPYPNLATVPSKTPSTGTTRERLQIEEGLLADRQNARHVSGPVAGPDRPSSLPPEPPTRTTIIDPSARRAPAASPRTAAATPPAPRPGPGGAIGSIAYAPGSAALPEGSGRIIVRAAEFQRRLGGTIVVVGHAAKAEGDDAARRALAQQRATNIANGLLNLGVQRDQIRAVADNGRVDAARVDIALTPRR